MPGRTVGPGVAQSETMGWLRAGVAALGVSLAAVGVLAWLIDHEGVTRLEMKRFGPDVVVVLGARVEPDGTASPVLAARVQHAVKVLRQRDVLLFSGGIGTHGASEASVARDLAVQLGVEPERCLLEEESHSTFQNAEFSIRLLQERFPEGFNVVLVSDPYHLPRARRLFERFTGRHVSTRPVLNAPRHLAFPERIGWTLREVPALAKDLLLTR